MQKAAETGNQEAAGDLGKLLYKQRREKKGESGCAKLKTCELTLVPLSPFKIRKLTAQTCVSDQQLARHTANL